MDKSILGSQRATDSSGEACASDEKQENDHPGGVREIISAALAILDQGEELLADLPNEAYQEKNLLAFGASIGGHYRHCLDHFNCWLDGWRLGVVDYDDRKRDPRIEKDSSFALAGTKSLCYSLAGVPAEQLSRDVQVRCEVGYGRNQVVSTRSTLARELIYVIAHAIHHYALIAVIARMKGMPLPVNFGVAPSTVTYLAGRRVDAASQD